MCCFDCFIRRSLHVTLMLLNLLLSSMGMFVLLFGLYCQTVYAERDGMTWLLIVNGICAAFIPYLFSIGNNSERTTIRLVYIAFMFLSIVEQLVLVGAYMWPATRSIVIEGLRPSRRFTDVADQHGVLVFHLTICIVILESIGIACVTMLETARKSNEDRGSNGEREFFIMKNSLSHKGYGTYEDDHYNRD